MSNIEKAEKVAREGFDRAVISHINSLMNEVRECRQRISAEEKNIESLLKEINELDKASFETYKVCSHRGSDYVTVIKI